MEAITGLTFTMDGETYVLHNGAADEAETGEDVAASTEADKGTGDGAASADGWFYQGTELDVNSTGGSFGGQFYRRNAHRQRRNPLYRILK